MTNQSIWVIREIEHYETNQDLTPDTMKAGCETLLMDHRFQVGEIAAEAKSWANTKRLPATCIEPLSNLFKPL